MEINSIINPPENKNWEENDNFSTKVVEKSENIIEEIIDGATNTVNIAIEEAKTIAPDVVDVFEESSQRLNQKPRIIPIIPNNILIFGLLGLTVYVVIKKVF
jgi:hypothetical protein